MWTKRADLKAIFHSRHVRLSHRQRSQQYLQYPTKSRRLRGVIELPQNRNVSFYSTTALLWRCDGDSNDHASMGLVYADWCRNTRHHHARPIDSLHHAVQHRSMSSGSMNSNSRNNESRLDDGRKDSRNDEEFSSKGTKRMEDYNECVKRVQKRDYDAYLCGLLLPKQAREHYFAIRAFNIEIASIKDGGTTMIKRRAAQDGTTSASLATQLRMQWWSDALSLLLQNQRSRPTQTPSSTTTTTTSTTTTQSSFFENPLVRCLHHTITQKNLTPRFLERLVTSRSDHLDTLQHPNLNSLLRYSDHTSCSLLYLTLECCDILNDDADEVAFQAGIGVGITQAIRGIVAGCRPDGSGEIGIPMEVMERWGVSLRYLQDPPASAAWAGGIGIGAGEDTGEGMEEHDGDRASREALQKAVEEMVNVARYHLGKARSMQGKVPKGASSCFLPAVLAIEYLDRLEGVGYNVFHTDMVEGDSFRASRIRLKRSFLLLRAWLTGVF